MLRSQHLKSDQQRGKGSWRYVNVKEQTQARNIEGLSGKNTTDVENPNMVCVLPPSFCLSGCCCAAHSDLLLILRKRVFVRVRAAGYHLYIHKHTHPQYLEAMPLSSRRKKQVEVWHFIPKSQKNKFIWSQLVFIQKLLNLESPWFSTRG